MQGRPGAAEKKHIDENSAPRSHGALPTTDCPWGESAVFCKDSQVPPACPSSDTVETALASLVSLVRVQCGPPLVDPGLTARRDAL